MSTGENRQDALYNTT